MEPSADLPDMTRPTRTPRAYARSNATRLLSAGAYLEKSFRARVIDELVKHQYRVVAPSYGYDAVTVLGHALAARSLRRKQIAGIVVGAVIILLMLGNGVVGLSGAFILVLCLLWAAAVLRRAVTIQALITRLRPAAGAGTDAEDIGDNFPANPALTGRLADKIGREQAGATEQIFYGGFWPFVGAGWRLPDWSVAELLIPERPNPLAEYLHPDAADDEPSAPRELIPFTVNEITEYVRERLQAELRVTCRTASRLST
jgi:hypothetical protein